MKKHDKPELRENRKELRRHLTSAEAFLWKHLQQKKLEGKKFRRQHSIDSFIVDFYCAAEKLIIELDGEVHSNPITEERDAKRDAYLNRLGYKVIRFENKMVFEHLSSVLQEIKDSFKN
ncbi:MAG: endonuclease domain-containing protein [Croceivirga sp.]